MRGLRFRAWDTGNKNYRIDGFFIRPDGKVGSYTDRVLGVDLLVEQFTGLKDKNGKDIFEGDIVNGWCDFGPGGEEQRVFPVVMTSFGCSIEPWNYKEDGYLPEIIGNIHQNLELLK